MQIIICDKCKKEPTRKVYIPLDTQTDAAGGPSESIGPTLDLCQDCLAHLLDFYTRNGRYGEMKVETHKDNARILEEAGFERLVKRLL